MADGNKDLEKPWQRERRMFEHDIKRGSKFQPFSIEPMPYERQRLSGAGMTDADRAARRQWLLDQQLSPNEPRHIPELKPKNIIKRIYGKPWDIFFGAIRPIVHIQFVNLAREGETAAGFGRFYIPKGLMILGSLWAFYYHIKYNSMSWERDGGWAVYKRHDVLLGSNSQLPTKQQDEFCDRGFKARPALKDLNTSI